MNDFFICVATKRVDAFCTAVKTGNLCMAEQMLVHYPSLSSYISSQLLSSACTEKSMSMPLTSVKWVVSRLPPASFDDNLQRCIKICSQANQVDILMELLSTRAGNNLIYQVLKTACANGYLQMAQQVYPLFPVGVEDCFMVACQNNQLEVAQWLLSVNPSLNTLENASRVFGYACDQGYLTMAQWLLSVQPSFDLAAKAPSAFFFAIALGHLKFAQWLCFKQDCLSNVSVESVCGCIGGPPETVQWLFQSLHKSLPSARFVELVRAANQVAVRENHTSLVAFLTPFLPPEKEEENTLVEDKECVLPQKEEESAPAKKEKEEDATAQKEEDAFLHWCCQNDVAKLEQLLLREQQCVFDFMEGCRQAIEHESITVLDVLLKRKPALMSKLSCKEGLALANNRVFCLACLDGHLHVAQWLLQVKPDICDGYSYAFRLACSNGHIHVAQWLLQVKPDIDVSGYGEDALRSACTNGHLHVAQWLLQVKPDINGSAHLEDIFRQACYSGHLPFAQWLLDTKPAINVSACNEYAFRSACGKGYLAVAQWLLQVKPDINVDENMFRSACTNGHLHVAQWLLQVKPDIHVNKNTFPCACGNGQLAVVQWLYQVKPSLDVSANNDEAFRSACTNGHLTVVQWLLSIRSIDVAIVSHCLGLVCNKGHKELATLLFDECFKASSDI